MTARVTVGIAFHDEERWLAAAIRSVLAQSYRDFELVLADDGSRDRSREVARGFLGDPRVQLVEHPSRRHLAARLNELVSRARGAVFVRMDADDVMHPERLARQVAHLDGAPACDAVGTWAGLVDETERAIGVLEGRSAPAAAAVVLERGVIAHATMAARVPWLRRYPYDETLTRAEDRDLWCRVGLSSRIDVLREVLYVVRVVPDDVCFRADYLRGQADYRRVLLRYGPRLAGWPRTCRQVCASVLKSGVMAVVPAGAARGAIVRRRARAPSSDELARIERAIAAGRPSGHSP
jgi:glycosyltransferase involved in cell wall biosynthesis